MDRKGFIDFNTRLSPENSGKAQLLFDEGITSNKRTMLEQQMNLDLKVAYDYGREWIKQHEPITVDWLVLLASKVMDRTGSEYHSIGGDFSAAKGELTKDELNSVKWLPTDAKLTSHLRCMRKR